MKILMSYVGCVLWLSVPTHAYAQEKQPYAAEIQVIAASESPGHIAPELAKEPALKHRAFRAYRTMKLLATHRLALESNKDVNLVLPNGRQLHLTLQKVLPDGRLKVQMSINHPKQSDYVRSVQMVLASKKPIFQAGQRMGDQDLILGIRIR
jgi:hypothetical protein